MSSAVILYYSSNREHPEFEARVIDNLLRQSGGLPIISISQKPLDLGQNICVGEVGASGFNMFRQVQIGLMATEADLVISAEADCLYPPDYFQFRPPRLDVCYRNRNLYVMPDRRAYFFYKPTGATHAQVVGRQFYLERLRRLFAGAPEWSEAEKNFPKERHRQEDIFKGIQYWSTEHPVIQIKTHRGMRYYTHSERLPIHELPYWGEGRALRERMLCGCQ